jgi:hypothetical protein
LIVKKWIPDQVGNDKEKRVSLDSGYKMNENIDEKWYKKIKLLSIK